MFAVMAALSFKRCPCDEATGLFPQVWSDESHIPNRYYLTRRGVIVGGDTFFCNSLVLEKFHHSRQQHPMKEW
jgi:hypothetical protein